MSATFEFSSVALHPGEETARVADPACGGFVSFEGWVREVNEGQRVTGLEYEAYAALAVREGQRIVSEAEARFGVRQVRCVHRVGALRLGELAVWVGVASPHRAEAFAACRYVIDEVKHRVPIWKKEHYASGDSGWVNCERCAQPSSVGDDRGQHPHRHTHTHDHTHDRDPVAPAATAVLPASDYGRQTLLPEVGSAGQARLRSARVLVVGAGGLGVPVLSYLAGAGIGVLGVMDHDTLSPSNLHRQTVYALADAGQSKALLATRHLRALNPDVDVRPYVQRATAASLGPLLVDYDVVVDCSDNFTTTFAVHDAARTAGIDAVYASIYQYEGQLQVVRGLGAGSCLRCVWDSVTPDGVVGNCAQSGVLGPVPGVLGSLQAMETLKLLLDLPGGLRDEVLLVDLLSLETRRIRAPRHAACTPACVRPGMAAPKPGVERHFADLPAVLRAGFILVDIREPEEIATSPTPVAALALPMARLLDDPTLLPPDRDALLLCSRGIRSLGTATALRERGHARVWSLAGGLEAQRSAV